MRLLLDTNALLWWQSDDPKLGPEARDLIADPSNDILISDVSLWEIVVKVRVGKLEADIGEIVADLDPAGFARLGIGLAHLERLASLPIHHRDPFDHLLIAQAISEDVPFISGDRRLAAYPVRMIHCG